MSPPGGAPDIVARLIGQPLSQRLGQPVVIENRPGGGGNLALQAVARAPADGYTLLLIATPHAVNVTLYEKLNVNVMRDIVPVASIDNDPFVMVVNPSLPARTVAEFIAYAKANPGKINMGSSGSGNLSHLAGELFKMMTGTDMVHVPYRGMPAALTALMTGDVHVVFDALPSSISHVKEGKVRALGVTTGKRVKALPDVPAVADTVPGYVVTGWLGIGVPKGTPAGDHRQAQQGNQRGARRSRDRGAARQHRQRTACRLARRFRQVHRGGNREMGQGGPVRRPQGRLIAALTRTAQQNPI